MARIDVKEPFAVANTSARYFFSAGNKFKGTAHSAANACKEGDCLKW